MLWTEDSAGTNAIGTALAIDHAVQIFSAEHFLSEQHAWWCSAAPIHAPRTGEILGVVNLSGPIRTANPHSLALVMAAAEMAETVLLSGSDREDERLRQAYRLSTTGRLGERTALVLFIDDLQWGDAEGATRLTQILCAPGAPSMLVIGTYRTEEADRSDCLRALLPALRGARARDADFVAPPPES